MKTIKRKKFENGIVYALQTDDEYPIEVTSTHLPFYTKNAIGRKQNYLCDKNLGSYSERWMIGVSCMSGCPVGCKFCATGQLRRWRNLKSDEITEQVTYAIDQVPVNFLPEEAKEFKINYTRMGEPFLNIEEVKKSIKDITAVYPNTHHYISTIGVKGSDFSWIEGNITLQISLHSLDEKRRNDLIPMNGKMSLKELGSIRTKSNLKTTVNLTLVDNKDFDIEKLKAFFDPEYFFIKLSPINPNEVSDNNKLGLGVVKSINLV